MVRNCGSCAVSGARLSSLEDYHSHSEFSRRLSLSLSAQSESEFCRRLSLSLSAQSRFTESLANVREHLNEEQYR